ncbi:hypothetical protein HX798_23060 [Pseudomonas putida]|uniref:Uncharacterized protein n=1 Tax=Pseudomonas putida TaxID=303 RepID=A0A7Y7ZFN3_PSEPU|nr:hypothetical protein [Pseudomonas putida]NWC83145.1 hypothetical protein [Pseudomonas putida]
MELKLAQVWDLDDDHEVGGQDLPNEVTIKVIEGTVEEALLILDSPAYSGIGVFSLARGDAPGTVTFLSFSCAKHIFRRFGIEPVENR